MAETPTITLTSSWQKIATGGDPSAVDIQVMAGQVFVTTVDCSFTPEQPEPGPPSSSVLGKQLLSLEHRCFGLTGADIYARAGTAGPTAGGAVTVMDGVNCGGREYEPELGLLASRPASPRFGPAP